MCTEPHKNLQCCCLNMPKMHKVYGATGMNAVVIDKKSCTCTIILLAANSQNNIRTSSKHSENERWRIEKHLIPF